MQLIVATGARTLVLPFADADEVDAAAVLARVERLTAVPSSALRLLRQGRALAPSAPVSERDGAFLRAELAGGLSGGKGGFGAMLRTLGRAAGAKRTTDFGACRDLQGRRLRHVNAELATARSYEQPVEGASAQPTPTGIDGWHLGVPAWAEGFKGGKLRDSKSSHGARMKKTSICKDWQRARAKRPAPAGAPAHWGCPKGRKCDYAHGEEELRGAAREALDSEQQQAKRARLQRERDEYSDLAAAGSGIADAVRAGLARRASSSSSAAAAAAASQAEAETPLMHVAADGSTATEVAELPCLLPSAGVVGIGCSAEVEGVSEFGTASIFGCALTEGIWYYEVELLTGGLMQIGWGDASFRGNSDSGDGVGDDEHSWAYDGARQRCWHGDSQPFGEAWAPGAVVGCTLNLEERSMSFSLDGRDLGAAFTGLEAPVFFPAVSLEKGESARINLGQRPLRFGPPAGARPVLDHLPLSSAAAAPALALPSPTVSAAPAPAPAAPTSVAPAPAPAPVAEKAPPVAPEALDLAPFGSAQELEALGLDRLKAALMAGGFKCGGSLQDRAARLFSTKGKSEHEIDPKIRAKRRRAS